MITITVNVDPGTAGSVAINGAVGGSYPYARSYREDTTVKLEARPAEGYQFTGWSGDISGSKNPTSIKLSASVSITALFSSVTHIITVAASGSGTITPEIGGHDYNEGKVINITASADQGWKFDGWSGDVANPASETTTVTADSDKKVTAKFSRLMHTLTVSSSYGGATPSAVGTYQYEEGTTADVVTTVENGWQFAGWTGDVVDPAATTTEVVMDSDKTVTANFSRLMHTLTVNSSYGGATPLTVETHQYAEGTTVDVAVTVENGWEFAGWTGDVVDPAATTTKVVMDSDKTVTANFSVTGGASAQPATPPEAPPAQPEAGAAASSGSGVLVAISIAVFLAILLPIVTRRRRVRGRSSVTNKAAD